MVLSDGVLHKIRLKQGLRDLFSHTYTHMENEMCLACRSSFADKSND